MNTSLEKNELKVRQNVFRRIKTYLYENKHKLKFTFCCENIRRSSSSLKFIINYKIMITTHSKIDYTITGKYPVQISFKDIVTNDKSHNSKSLEVYFIISSSKKILTTKCKLSSLTTEQKKIIENLVMREFVLWLYNCLYINIVSN